MTAETTGNQETVFWVNRFSKRGVRKIMENFRILEPSKEEVFTTIAIAEINELEDERLRTSLNNQLQDVRMGAHFIELPVVHMPHKTFSHSYGVLSKAASDRVHTRIRATALNDSAE
jgi:hypothetical protein